MSYKPGDFFKICASPHLTPIQFFFFFHFFDYIAIARALAATLEYKGNSKYGRSGFSVSMDPLYVSSRTVGK